MFFPKKRHNLHTDEKFGKHKSCHKQNDYSNSGYMKQTSANIFEVQFDKSRDYVDGITGTTQDDHVHVNVTSDRVHIICNTIAHKTCREPASTIIRSLRIAFWMQSS